MSRIGRMAIELPAGVQVEIKDGRVTVKGPKGELTRLFHPEMIVSLEESKIVVRRPTDSRKHRSLHGLTRALLANMVQGVSEGFRKELEIVGVGYRAEMQGGRLVLSVGYSHPVEIVPPEGITITVDRGAKGVVVQGVDKELVGQIAAQIRAAKKPEPYKGKGIRYVGEQVRRKAGKAGRIGGA